MNLPRVGNELERGGRVRADYRDPNDAGVSALFTETPDSPIPGTSTCNGCASTQAGAEVCRAVSSLALLGVRREVARIE
jgi:hypothetical protein